MFFIEMHILHYGIYPVNSAVKPINMYLFQISEFACLLLQNGKLQPLFAPERFLEIEITLIKQT